MNTGHELANGSTRIGLEERVLHSSSPAPHVAKPLPPVAGARWLTCWFGWLLIMTATSCVDGGETAIVGAAAVDGGSTGEAPSDALGSNDAMTASDSNGTGHSKCLASGLPAGTNAEELEVVTVEGVYAANTEARVPRSDRPTMAVLQWRWNRAPVRFGLWRPSRGDIDFSASGSALALAATVPLMAEILANQRAELVDAMPTVPHFPILRDAIATNAEQAVQRGLSIAPDDADAHPELNPLAEIVLFEAIETVAGHAPQGSTLPVEMPPCISGKKVIAQEFEYCDGGSNGVLITNPTLAYYVATYETATGITTRLIDAKEALFDVKFKVSKDNLWSPSKWWTWQQAVTSLPGITGCSTVSMTRGLLGGGCGPGSAATQMYNCLINMGDARAQATAANIVKLLAVSLDLVGVIGEAPSGTKVANAITKLKAMQKRAQNFIVWATGAKGRWSLVYLALLATENTAKQMQDDYAEPELKAKLTTVVDTTAKLRGGLLHAAKGMGISEEELQIAWLQSFNPAASKALTQNQNLVKARLASYMCNFAGGPNGKYKCGKQTQYTGDKTHLLKLVGNEALRDFFLQLPSAAVDEAMTDTVPTALLLFSFEADLTSKNALAVLGDIQGLMLENGEVFAAVFAEIAGDAMANVGEDVAKALLTKALGGWATVGLAAAEIANKAAPLAVDLATATDFSFCADLTCAGPGCTPVAPCPGPDGNVCGDATGANSSTLYSCYSGKFTPVQLCGNGCQGTPGAATCKAASKCGNGACDSGETTATCSKDCPASAVCKNGTCEPTETPSNCPQDCSAEKKCGDGICQPGEACPGDCSVANTCGNGKCDAGDATTCPKDCQVAGFCTGKANGPWCLDLDTLITCKAGKQTTSAPCEHGCQVMPDGSADFCRKECPGSTDWGVVRLDNSAMWAVEPFKDGTTTAHRIHDLASYKALGSPKHHDISKAVFNKCYQELRSIDGSDNPLLKVPGAVGGTVWMYTQGQLRPFATPCAYCACGGVNCGQNCTTDWKDLFNHATQGLLDLLNPCSPAAGPDCLYCEPGSPVTCSNGQTTVCSAVCGPTACNCQPNASKKCDGKALVWFDSCGNKGSKADDCPYGCDGASAACLACKPACDGKTCGPDGCGGECGNCGAGTTCDGSKCQCNPNASKTCIGKDLYYQDGCGNPAGLIEPCKYDCVAGACTACKPACAGKMCGSNGCGGSCGTCAAGTTCSGSTCECIKNSSKVCVGDELYWQTGCGELGDKIDVCKAGCADGKCKVCTPACAGKSCGADGCGGLCGSCPAGVTCAVGACVCSPNAAQVCSGANVIWQDSCGKPGAVVEACKLGCADGKCKVCTPACAGKSCGDDGCGGQCGSCPTGAACSSGACVCSPNAAQVCSGANVIWQDSCGKPGAVVAVCKLGCADSKCKVCTPACAGKSCGDDGCGGQCGSCPAGATCAVGACVCSPNDVKVCSGANVIWQDSCGKPGAVVEACKVGCADGKCKVCTPVCAGKSCGDDGCGGQCGSCSAGATCANGACVCAPNAAKVCGGANVIWQDSCGKAGAVIEVCKLGCADGKCKVCTPACAGKACGDDGCGGTCGQCAVGQTCGAGQTCKPVTSGGLDCSASWPDNCNPFAVTLPAGTAVTQLEFWSATGNTPYLVPVTPAGGTFYSPHAKGFVACAATVKWAGQWPAWQAGAFPGPDAPQGSATLCTTQSTVSFQELPLGSAAYGVAHDGNYQLNPYVTVQVVAPQPANVHAWYAGVFSDQGTSGPSPWSLPLTKSQACVWGVELAVQEKATAGGWYGCDPWMPALGVVKVAVNGKPVVAGYAPHPWTCGGKGLGNLFLAPAVLGCK